jgi:hypothetical protein
LTKPLFFALESLSNTALDTQWRTQDSGPVDGVVSKGAVERKKKERAR